MTIINIRPRRINQARLLASATNSLRNVGCRQFAPANTTNAIAAEQLMCDHGAFEYKTYEHSKT